MPVRLLEYFFSALLFARCISAQNFGSLGNGPITVGGIEFADEQFESLNLYLFEGLRDRPLFTPGATDRTCCDVGSSCIQDPATLYGRCTGRFLKAEVDGCPSGCQFQLYSDDAAVGFCGLPGGPPFSAAELQTLIDCDVNFPDWSEVCEDAQVNFVLSQGGGEGYAKELRNVFMCQRQPSGEECSAVELDDCPPVVPEWGKCSGSGIDGVKCCEYDEFWCRKKNDFYGQCRSGDVPDDWDGAFQRCSI